MASCDTPSSLREFTECFSNEEACARYLFECRWPTGFICPRCGAAKGYRIERRTRVECANPKCRYQVSVTAGTIMHRTKQDLTTWFHAAYLVSTLTPGISAVQFQRQLGLSRYETAFTMLHKLRSAMVAPDRELLHAEVEVDDGYIGGEEAGRPGRGALNKALVACAVELVRWTDKKSGKDRVRTGRVRLRTIPDASAESLLPFVRESVEKGAIVHTDGWPSYSALASEGYDHRPAVQGKEQEYMRHVHRIFSNLKTWLLGTHHGRVSKKRCASVPQRIHIPVQPAFLAGTGISSCPWARLSHGAVAHVQESISHWKSRWLDSPQRPRSEIITRLWGLPRWHDTPRGPGGNRISI